MLGFGKNNVCATTLPGADVRLVMDSSTVCEGCKLIVCHWQEKQNHRGNILFASQETQGIGFQP